MLDIIENSSVATLSLEDIDAMPSHEAESFINSLESDTQWNDPEKNVMMNGANMNCRK